MNIQRLPEHIIRWAVIVGGILFGLFSVKLAGQNQYGRLALIYGILGYVTLTLIVGPKIWVAIPVMWGLSGQIPSLDLPFTVRDLAVMLVFATCLVFKAFKRFNRKAKYEWVDILLILLVLYTASCWIRNPVGVDALGSDRVGGRPYFNVVIGCLAFWVLSRCTLRPKSANKLAVAVTCGRMFEGVVALILDWTPTLAPFLASYYTSALFTWASDPDSAPSVPGAESTERMGYLLAIGQPLVLCLCCYAGPLQLLNPLPRFWRPLLLVLGLICILLSGFRSAIASAIGFFVVSAYFWRGRPELAKLAVCGCIALAFVVLGQGTFFELPRSAQRALSFLPGRWDEYSKLEAQESTKWRTDMWKEMLTTDRYIDTPVIGDGFGFKKRDLELMFYFRKFGSAESRQESFMISGQVHSGPVSSIKFVGYIGLAMILTILIGMAITAWKLVWRAKRTPYFILALFIGIPAMIEPFYFTFIFGGFENALPESLLTLGMLRMLRNSLDDFAAPQTVASAIPSLADAEAKALDANAGEYNA